MIIPELTYFVMLICSVNIHVNTVAKGNPIKAVIEGSIILHFERLISTRERLPKEIQRLVCLYVRISVKRGIFQDQMFLEITIMG